MPALIQSLVVYLIIGMSFFGWGILLINYLSIKGQSYSSGSFHIWIGWAFTLLLFQLLHLFFPVNAYIVIPIYAIGIIFTFKYVMREFHIPDLESLKTLKFVGFSLIMLLLVVWIALKSMLSPTHYDAGLYYFNAIRWINSYPNCSRSR